MSAGTSRADGEWCVAEGVIEREMGFRGERMSSREVPKEDLSTAGTYGSLPPLAWGPEDSSCWEVVCLREAAKRELAAVATGLSAAESVGVDGSWDTAGRDLDGMMRWQRAEKLSRKEDALKTTLITRESKGK